MADVNDGYSKAAEFYTLHVLPIADKCKVPGETIDKYHDAFLMYVLGGRDPDFAGLINFLQTPKFPNS